MKTIILAGGHATRLWPLTRNRAKPLLPLAGKPIIQYVLEDLEELDPDKTIVSTNARYADDFREFLEVSGYGNVEVKVEEHEGEEDKLGSLGAIIQVIEEEGEDDYLVVGGDNYASLDLEAFVGFAREKGGITNACHDVSIEDAKDFGVVETEGERITGFEEKPGEPSSTLVSTLFYYVPGDSVGVLKEYSEENSEKEAMDAPGQLLEWACTRRELYAYRFDGDWFDIGTPQNYLQAQGKLDGKRVEGEMRDSELGENVWVMEGAEVEGSRLEGCIVFPAAKITGSTLQGTIVDREVTLEGKELENSVIGEFSLVT